MDYFIRPESYGFLDDPEACVAWQVVSQTAFGTEFADFPTLAEAVSWMRRFPNDEHLVQGLDEDECAITNAFTLDDIVEVAP